MFQDFPSKLTSRRQLLRVGLGSLPIIAIGNSVPFLVPKFAFARNEEGTPVPKDNILVVVQLSGGNDGLNTVIPFKHDSYKKARPRLALEEGIIKLDDEFALNPGMGAFKQLWDEGMLAIVHGCGYPQPNRSHFESMAIWHAAQTDGGSGTGWLGHYLDHLARGTQAKAISNPLKAVNIGREVPMALVSPEINVPSVDSIEDFGLRFHEGSAYDKDLERQIIIELQKLQGENPALEYLGRQATDAIISADEIRSVAGRYQPDANYPGALGQRLRLIAQLICGNFGTRVFYCETGGFDTHANQLNTHQNLLQNVSDSIRAFFNDLTAKKISDKVTVMVFSEFGRRVDQNANDGTDHGAAAPMFVVGPKVQGGYHGQHPAMDNLFRGDLQHTVDFRSVYGAMLRDWLNADPEQVLKAGFPILPVIQGAEPLTIESENPPEPPEPAPAGEPSMDPSMAPSMDPSMGGEMDPSMGGGMENSMSPSMGGGS